jgi:hypothetical protein
MHAMTSMRPAPDGLDRLQAEHTPSAVRGRLSIPARQSYLRDAIYGAIDGSVTTFAIVCGVQGAGLSAGIVMILGVANLLADGFSMAASNFLGTRADQQLRRSARRQEEAHVATIPEGEREEIRLRGRGPGARGQHHHLRRRTLG